MSGTASYWVVKCFKTLASQNNLALFPRDQNSEFILNCRWNSPISYNFLQIFSLFEVLKDSLNLQEIGYRFDEITSKRLLHFTFSPVPYFLECMYKNCLTMTKFPNLLSDFSGEFMDFFAFDRPEKGARNHLEPCFR